MAAEYAWSQTEPALAILCACLTTYRPFFRKAEKKSPTPSTIRRPQPPSDWTDMENTSRSRIRFPVADDFEPRNDLAGQLGNSTFVEVNLDPEKGGLQVLDFSDAEHHITHGRSFDITAEAGPEHTRHPTRKS